MELIWVGVAVLVLIALNVLAMRYGADSRGLGDQRQDWW